MARYRRTAGNLITLISAILIGALGLEMGLRIFVTKSRHSEHGELFGVVLPPSRLFPAKVRPQNDPRRTVALRAPGGQALTLEDLSGIFQEDPDLGYEPQENARSLNGWWRSNNVGAVRTADASRRPSPGRMRIAVFGDSYAQASRIPSADSWTAQLEKLAPASEILNFGVDGYSMAQSYLRLQKVNRKLSLPHVIMSWVPDADLCREVNTIRYLMFDGWNSFTVMPRFQLENDQLTLVPGLYSRGTEIYDRDLPDPTPALVAHLREHDRFYVQRRFEKSGPFPGLLLSRLLNAYLARRELNRLWRELKHDVDSEAMRITRKIFIAARSDLEGRGGKFHVLALPAADHLRGISEGPSARRVWDEWLRVLRDDGIQVLDLLPTLAAIPEAELDLGFDGSHYGPKTNRKIAEAVQNLLEAKLK